MHGANNRDGSANYVSSGVTALDDVIQGFRLGDNVVWQVERFSDYVHLAHAFGEQAQRDHRTLVYVRFGTHPPVWSAGPGRVLESFDPRDGFDVFSAQIHYIITRWGPETFYVFDDLSCLVELWATDELLANFFQATCPYLFELDTVAYFALDRGRHANEAVTRIRDTTQVLLDAFYINETLHVRPLKVWQRHAPHMFWPHRVEDAASWIPIAPDEAPPTDLTYETTAPWKTVYAELLTHNPEQDIPLPSARLNELRRELSQMLLGGTPRIQELADTYLSLDTLLHVRRRVVGSGRIGGKAVGMLLARAIAQQDCSDIVDTFPLLNDDAFHVGSDVFYTFLIRNDLFRERLAITRAGRISREKFAALEDRFVAGDFDEARINEFRELLEVIGETPIIVRSSSLLEDGFGNAFAGKYRSEFCVNCGPLEQRLAAFLRAIKLVYASTLNPDALSYRRNRNMLESDEQMAILVQRVAGEPHGRYFFPMLAGVAFSRNLYAWTERIDPRAGVIRLVFGLGTRAVNRVSRDYPRLIAVSHPELRPEIGDEVAAYSQRHVDVLDLDDVSFATIRLAEVFEEARHPALHLLASIWHSGYLSDAVGRHIDLTANIVLTFNRLLKETQFVERMGRMLAALEAAYKQPVDTEFTAHIDRKGHVQINLLQCRPMWLPGATDHVEIPQDIPVDRVLFTADRFINGGILAPIRFVMYINPTKYAELANDSLRKSLARIVGQINQDTRIDEGRIMLMGPGRWGSSNPDLGIGVTYADIDHVNVLVEIAQEAHGHVPEVSYGTHFFQDLVEAEIVYVPLYPQNEATRFNATFFEETPNALLRLFPHLGMYADIVQLIDIPGAHNGQHVQLVADPESRRALCYLG